IFIQQINNQDRYENSDGAQEPSLPAGSITQKTESSTGIISKYEIEEFRNHNLLTVYQIEFHPTLGKQIHHQNDHRQSQAEIKFHRTSFYIFLRVLLPNNQAKQRHSPESAKLLTQRLHNEECSRTDPTSCR